MNFNDMSWLNNVQAPTGLQMGPGGSFQANPNMGAGMNGWAGNQFVMPQGQMPQAPQIPGRGGFGLLPPPEGTALYERQHPQAPDQGLGLLGRRFRLGGRSGVGFNQFSQMQQQPGNQPNPWQSGQGLLGGFNGG